MTMTPVTKQMHEETSEKEHEREIRGNMLPVVDNEIEPDEYE